MENLLAFDGRVDLVNAKYESIGGRRCFPSVSSLPHVPDCVVIALNRNAVESVVEECAAKGVGGVIVYAAGYAETGDAELVALQDRLTAISAASGLRIIGPNCIGPTNHVAKAAMTFTPTVRISVQNSAAIGIVSQSGGMANALALAVNDGLSVSHALTAGNSCDVDCADLVAYLAEDPHCRAIALAFEGVASTERLIEAGEIAWAAGKPLIIQKLARGERGAAAAMSHTGFLTGSSAAYQAAFDRVGAIVPETLESLVETTAFFAKAGSPKASGIVVVTASGGSGIQVADEAESRSVPMPGPSQATRATLSGMVPSYGSLDNPVDVTAGKNSYGRAADCIDVLLNDNAYGAAVFPHFFISEMPSEVEALQRLGSIAEKHGKPVAVTWACQWHSSLELKLLNSDPHVSVFASAASCMDALAAWQGMAARRSVPVRGGARTSPDCASSARALILQSAHDVLGESHAKKVLADYGISVVHEALVSSPQEAVDAAGRIGYPVGIKLESPDVPHKTEAGVVKLNLSTKSELLDAYSALMANAGRISPPPRINGVVVQPMVSAGTEIVIGGRIDPQFGPLVMVGLGGVFVEVLHDSVVALAPVTRVEAGRMLASLKNQKMLDGFRGLAAVDRQRLADAIARVSELLADQRDILAELDINPLICNATQTIAVDALMVRARERHEADHIDVSKT